MHMEKLVYLVMSGETGLKQQIVNNSNIKNYDRINLAPNSLNSIKLLRQT